MVITVADKLGRKSSRVENKFVDGQRDLTRALNVSNPGRRPRCVPSFKLSKYHRNIWEGSHPIQKRKRKLIRDIQSTRNTNIGHGTCPQRSLLSRPLSCSSALDSGHTPEAALTRALDFYKETEMCVHKL